MNTVITRFAPSPTGYLHVGGARTAFFNWLYARNTGGKFILRIEDTDLVRSSRKSVNAIFEALKWLEIDWDEGPYFQTERYDIYQYYLQSLLDSGRAYYCNCSQNDVDAMRKKAISIGSKPKYNGACRKMGHKNLKNSVVRFKAPLDGTTVLNDVIKGNITFQNTEQDDFILCRSDGSPTYNFVVVVDDIVMNVNTVIRGDDHVMNTPKQIMLYNAFKRDLPVFGHVPMVLGGDRVRLSKRHGAASVIAYRDMGYLPDAFLNHIVRLGWSHGDEEFFSRDDLIKKFNIENIGKSPSVFDSEKLMSLNAQHIRASEGTQLTRHILPFMKEKGYNLVDNPYLQNVIGTLRDRSKTLLDMAESARFYYEEVLPPYDKKASDKFLTINMIEPISLLIMQLQVLKSLEKEKQEAMFKCVMSKTNLSFGKIAQSVRLVLTGGTVSPGIFEVIEVLGKEVVLRRLKMALDFIISKKS